MPSTDRHGVTYCRLAKPLLIWSRKMRRKSMLRWTKPLHTRMGCENWYSAGSTVWQLEGRIVITTEMCPMCHRSWARSEVGNEERGQMPRLSGKQSLNKSHWMAVGERKIRNPFKTCWFSSFSTVEVGTWCGKREKCTGNLGKWVSGVRVVGVLITHQLAGWQTEGRATEPWAAVIVPSFLSSQNGWNVRFYS